MKKTLPLLLLFVLALLIFNGIADHSDMHFVIDDADFDGPFGALLGAVLAGGGIIIGTVVMLFVALLLALLFAGMGVVAIAALALAAVVAVIAISPLLLPILIPCLIVWFMARRKPAPAPVQLKEGTL